MCILIDDSVYKAILNTSVWLPVSNANILEKMRRSITRNKSPQCELSQRYLPQNALHCNILKSE